MIFDIHSHILPKVDDGASSLEESVELLKILKSQKVDAVIATPHLDISSGKAEKVATRAQQAMETLKKAAENIPHPEMFLGYEVAYFRGISKTEEVKKYTISGTNYILIELPMFKIDEKTVDDILEMAYNFNLIPIFAHLERYFKVEGFKDILSLVEQGDAFAQITAEAFRGLFNRNKADKLIEGGYVSFVGSDCHSVLKRPPKINEFYESVLKRYSEGFIKFLSENNIKLYNQITKTAAK